MLLQVTQAGQQIFHCCQITVNKCILVAVFYIADKTLQRLACFHLVQWWQLARLTQRVELFPDSLHMLLLE